MDTLKFAFALAGEGMDPQQAVIIAHEMYRIYGHPVLGGVYKPVDNGDLETLRTKVNLRRAKKEAMNNVIRAMTANDADAEKHWQDEVERIDAERRRLGFIS